MPYDPALAERIRSHLSGTPGLHEQKMFGGVGWTVHGNMAAGAHSDGRLMIRCAKEDFGAFTAEPGAEGMVHGGRPMSGWVLVAPGAVIEDAVLARWIDRGRAYAASLPPK